MQSWDKLLQGEPASDLAHHLREEITMLSSDTGTWIRALSAKFARHLVKLAEVEVRYIPVVPCEDGLLHTESSPFCADERCPCHDTATNGELFAEYIEQPVMDGLLTASEALRLYWGEQV